MDILSPKILDMSRDLKLTKLDEVDSLEKALRVKLDNSYPKDAMFFEEVMSELLEIIIENIKEIIDFEFSETDTLEDVRDAFLFNPSLKEKLALLQSIKRKAKRIIYNLNEYEINEDTIDFTNDVVNFFNEYNRYQIQADVVPLLKRGVYSLSLKRSVNDWVRNRKHKGNDESFWQRELESNKKIIENMMGGYVEFFQSELNVGNTNLDGKGNKRSDFSGIHRNSNNINLVEIKTPNTPLVGREYRGTYPLSHEVSGSVAQVLTQKNELIKNYYHKVHNSKRKFEVISPKCYLIVGSLDSISLDEKRAFEMQRDAIASHVKIITFDELYEQFSNLAYD